MDNCSGKSISNETIFPNLIRIYFAISLFIVSIGVNGQTPINTNYKIKCVVIDAGHGGRDPGAVGKITYEKHITLGIAKKLGAYISQNLKDVKVVYTRTTDVFIPLDERSEIANRNKADVFISIHVNSLEDRHVYGTSSWVMGLHVSDENFKIAQRENSVIRYEDDHHTKYEGYDPTSAESHIMFKVMQNVFQDQSLSLAAKIQEQFRSRVGRKDRGVNQAGFVVLWKTSMPSVLVETGFISNAEEEKYLSSSAGQDYIASAIFRAFRSYKYEIEGTKPSVRVPDNKTVQLDKVTPVVSKEKGQSNIWFSVQVKSSPTKLPLNSPSFKALGNVFERKEGAFYKYFSGKVQTYEDVAALKNNAKRYFKDAFTVAFEKDTKIPVSAAVAKLKKQ